MEGLIAKFGFKFKATVAAVVAALAMSCGDELEVRTFDLNRLEAMEAEALITPYIFQGREGAPGLSSHTNGVLTVREMPENLDRIAEVLNRYDQAAAEVQLHFQIIEADGFTERDEAIADIETELRKLLRYDGYRLVGEAIMQTREGSQYTQQRVQPSISERNVGEGGQSPFEVTAGVGRVSRTGGEMSVLLEVGLSDAWSSLLTTTVTVTDGKTVVLGTTSGQANQEGRAAALILVVTPTIR